MPGQRRRAPALPGAALCRSVKGVGLLRCVVSHPDVASALGGKEGAEAADVGLRRGGTVAGRDPGPSRRDRAGGRFPALSLFLPSISAAAGDRGWLRPRGPLRSPPPGC